MKKPWVSERNRTHGLSHTKIYQVWKSMRRRCNNPKDKRYIHYGGKGVKVCERWDKFENFIKDMGFPPKGFSIERIDVNGDYCPENCTYIPLDKQSENSTQTRWMALGDEIRHMAGWAEVFGKSRATIREHLNKGRTLKELAVMYGYYS